MSESTEALHQLRPTSATWTHVALRVADIDASIAWYERFTPLRLLEKRQDDLGFGAWLGQPESVERPFILVLAQFLPETDPFGAYPQEVLAPFAHLGIELPTREALDETARGGEEAGCLAMAAAADAAADRLRVHAQRSRRQHDRVLLRSGRLRDGPGSLGVMSPEDRGPAVPGRCGPRRIWRRSLLATRTPSPPTSLRTSSTSTPAPSAGEAVGADEYRSRLPGFLASLPGLRYDVESVIADGVRVAVEYRLTATSEGHPIDVRGVMVIEVRDGLITRRTDYWDSLTYLRQTGAPAP